MFKDFIKAKWYRPHTTSKNARKMAFVLRPLHAENSYILIFTTDGHLIISNYVNYCCSCNQNLEMPLKSSNFVLYVGYVVHVAVKKRNFSDMKHL